MQTNVRMVVSVYGAMAWYFSIPQTLQCLLIFLIPGNPGGMEAATVAFTFQSFFVALCCC